MESYCLNNRIEVSFLAKAVCVRRHNKVYAHLLNGKLFDYDANTKECNKLFDEKRFSGVCFGIDNLYLVGWDGLLARSKYGSYSTEPIAVYEGAIDPFSADEELQECVFRIQNRLMVTDLNGTLRLQQELPFKPYSMARIDKDRICIGGFGLCVLNTATGKMDIIEKSRESPLFELSYNRKARTVAAAGFDDLCVYDLVNRTKINWDDISAKHCQFATNGELWFSCTSPDDGTPPELVHLERSGIKLHGFSHGAFCFAGSIVPESRVIVSAMNYLYEFIAIQE